MKEVLTIQAGQCGNQISKPFWKLIQSEHLNYSGQFSKYFFETTKGLKNRAILLDTEPRAIEQIFDEYFFSENILIHTEKTGAGNNWAVGNYVAKQMENEIGELVQRELEGCDDLECFKIFHSTAGGTGAGFSSFLINFLKTNYPKKLITTISVLPSLEISETVIQPYNSILCLSNILNSDNPILLDNSSIFKIKQEVENDYTNANFIIGSTVAGITRSIRFPSLLFSDFNSIASVLNLGAYNLKVPSVLLKENRKTKIFEILKKLSNNKNSLANLSVNTFNNNALGNCYYKNETISSLNFVYNSAPNFVKKGVLEFFEKSNTNFVKWMPPSYHSINVDYNSEVFPYEAVGLTNSTSICNLLKSTCDQFDKLKKRGAFLEMYRKYDKNLNEMNNARNKVENIIKEYSNTEI